MAFEDDNLAMSFVSAGVAHTMFVTIEGLLFGCGLNDRNQVGKVYSETHPDYLRSSFRKDRYEGSDTNTVNADVI